MVPREVPCAPPSLRGGWASVPSLRGALGLGRACEASRPTVLRRAPRDAPCVVDDLDCLAPSLARPTQDFRSTVVDVNEIYGLILGFTSKYKVTGPRKVRITIDQGGFQLGIYQH